ncbi:MULTISPECIES: L-aspartate oxidase [Desulfosediminicola]|uniref:L-aspartate oxidase n=1 Tax=Desulfosediminicola TaxID=2886823 RepID=UPI0010AC9AB0|nr:FAD-binding protein [Desulfosediminicola ganghwensis]
MSHETLKTDILILGMGAAGQLAALYAYDANPDLKITIVTKALKGKGGCSRMVQGGLNVVLNDSDSHEKHLMDTLKGGQYVNDQDLARTLVEEATPTIKEMETRFGCFFDRNPDGTIHQKPFAGQSFDRTVHKGDLTGIEMISRTTEQIMKRDIQVLEECRAVDLLTDDSGDEVTGALMLDMKQGRFVVIEAAATLVATGGGPTQYSFHAPGPEKSVDGLAMLYRAGVRLRDMEMIQFHPTGLIIPGSVVAGSLLEEGLRGAGAHLYNGEGKRYMHKYDPAEERATRDVVSRSAFLEMLAGRACVEGGIQIDAAHMGAEFVLKNFPGMAARCRQFGYDLARERVPISPTAHFVMGGADIDKNCHTSLRRLFVAGEDSGGVHGGNRLGGNGICESAVYGRQAGKSLARFFRTNSSTPPETAPGLVDELKKKFTEPFGRSGSTEDVFQLRRQLQECNWKKVGVVRNGQDMESAIGEINFLKEESKKVKVTGGDNYNMVWNTYIDLTNMIDVSDMVVASALARKESRAAHYRSDFPDQNDEIGLFNTYLTLGDNGLPTLHSEPVDFKYKSAEECRNHKK